METVKKAMLRSPFMQGDSRPGRWAAAVGIFVTLRRGGAACAAATSCDIAGRNCPATV